MEYSDLVKMLEELVRTPVYRVVGKLKDNLIYFSTSEGDFSLYSWKDGKTQKLTKSSIDYVAKPKPELDYLVFTRDVEKGKEIHSIYIANLKGEEYEVASPRQRIMWSLAYDEKRIAFTAISRTESSLYVIEDGKMRKIMNIQSMSFVADINGDYIVGFGNLKGDPKSQELFVATLSGEFKIITPKEGSTNTAYRIIGKKVYFSSDFEDLGESEWVYTYDLESGEFTRVEFQEKDIYDFKPVELVYIPEDSLIVASKEGERKIFLDGKLINTPAGFINGATKIGDYIYFSHSSLVSTPKIYRVSENKLEIVINNKNFDIGTVEKVKLKTDVEVPTWVIKSSQGKIPGTTIVYAHGGPWYYIPNAWSSFFASFALAGYHIVIPNFRGSTGYGYKYRYMDIGDPGGGDLRDVVKARDYAIEIGLANKIGIVGDSYGGYMTLLALGKESDKWDFGIAIGPVSDWIEMYELGDSAFKAFIDLLFNGHNEELMRERSPITYVKNVKVPVCIIHSQNDSRTPLLPVLKYVTELQKDGKSFEFHVIPDMGHMINSVDDIIKIELPAFLFLKRLEETQ